MISANGELMKALFLLGLLITQSVFALPYVCESDELDNGVPAMRFKVNNKVPVNERGTTWDLYMIGVTPSKGFRKIIYGSGSADKKGITMTFVKDSFVLGKVLAYEHNDGLFYGEANISDVAGNRTLTVVCKEEKK